MSSEIGRFHPLGMLDRFRLTSARYARSSLRAEVLMIDRRSPAFRIVAATNHNDLP